jgi:acyl carrier protein
MNAALIRIKLREFVIDNFLMGDPNAQLDDADSFLETGIVDSTGMLELVMFLEQNFELKIPDQDLLPENFDSIERLIKFVERKSSAAG